MPRPRRVTAKADASSPAATRRALLLTVIGSSADGLTTSDVRKQTPKMKGGDRSNALQKLKAEKQIRRVGNRWIVAA